MDTGLSEMRSKIVSLAPVAEDVREMHAGVPGRFWDMHDAIYRSPRPPTRDSLMVAGHEVGTARRSAPPSRRSSLRPEASDRKPGTGVRHLSRD